MRFKNLCFKNVDLIVGTSEDMFSAQGVKVNGRIQSLFKEGVSMWAELENKWVLNLKKKTFCIKRLSCLIALDFQTILNRHGEGEHLCLIPTLRGTAVNLSLLSRMSAVGLLYMAFIMLRYVLFIPKLLRVLNHARMLHFVKCFFVLLR